MKKAIGHLAGLSTEERIEMFSTALFVLDTNVLLSLYRASHSLRTKMLESFNKIQDRLWIPYHIANEFVNNKATELAITINRHKAITVSNDAYVEKLRKEFRLNDDELDNLNRRLRSWARKYKDNHLSTQNDDDLLAEIYKLFDGKVGKLPDAKTLEKYELEAEQRYQSKTPPGYKDDDKPSNKYGDTYIWFEMIRKSKDDNIDVILITDDKKEDWWQKHEGLNFGPRRELIKEFYEKTNGQRFYIYTLENFIKYQGVELERSSINELVSFNSNTKIAEMISTVYLQKFFDKIKESLAPYIIESAQILDEGSKEHDDNSDPNIEIPKENE